MVVPFFVLFVVIVPRMPFPENLVFGGIMIIFVLGAVLGIPAIEERRLRTFNFGEKKEAVLTKVATLPTASFFAEQFNFEYRALDSSETLSCSINKRWFDSIDYEKGNKVTIFIDPCHRLQSLILSQKLRDRYYLKLDKSED